MRRKAFHAAARAGSLALIVMAAPYSVGQITQQDDAATNATVQQKRPTLEELQRQIDELQRQINLLKQSGADSAETRGVKAAETPTHVAVVAGAEPSSMMIASSSLAAVSPNSVAALSEQKPVETKTPHSDPFAFADFTWLNGNARTKDTPYATKFFTPEVRSDVSYTYDFNHPADDTIVGSSEVFRAQEVVLTDLAVGGNFHLDHVQGRILTQNGLYSTATPRNDASPVRGQWQLDNAYRYLSEANAGYHFDVQHGLNVDAGIFLSYVGLFSFYQFDNWAYQPSYVSSNTPWFFTGVRVQYYPTEKLKIEPWIVNGWQSYGRFNNRPGLGGQILWRPNGKLQILGNQYGYGEDALGVGSRTRYHTDDSVEYKYLDHPTSFLTKAAFSLTGDLGCESGGGVSCFGNGKGGPKQSFVGFMAYNRFWFDRDQFGLTLGGGRINNAGRYLVLLPPINGATAASGTPYFTENPGDPFKAWDASVTVDYMPSQYFTYRLEYNHRAANVAYFAGPGGVTPPGGNQGTPGSVVPGWTPDLRNSENRVTAAFLLKF